LVYQDFSESDIKALIHILLEYKDKHNTRMIDQYGIEFLLSIIDHEKLKILEGKFAYYEEKGADIIDFVKIIILTIDHKETETIYIAIAAIDLFKEISEMLNMATTLKF
jgi:hypothetical protein